MSLSCAPRPRAARAAHHATITHTLPGEATITCHCRTLRTSVDVDDPQAAAFALWDHLRGTNATQLGVTDTRTGRRYSVTGADEPAMRLILTPAGAR